MGFEIGYNYLNSGVLLINCKKWRDTFATKRIIDYAVQNNKRLFAPDQDSISGTLYEESGLLPAYWNFSLPTYRSDDPIRIKEMSEKERIELKERPRLIHFISVKPWEYESAHPFKKEYQKYFNQTPWATLMEKDREIKLTLRLRKFIDYVKYRFPGFWYHILGPVLHRLRDTWNRLRK